MPAAKKHTSGIKKRKKQIPPVVVVTNTFLPAEDYPFPEKLKMAQEILAKTKFLDH
jgi:hypothetical protein